MNIFPAFLRYNLPQSKTGGNYSTFLQRLTLFKNRENKQDIPVTCPDFDPRGFGLNIVFLLFYLDYCSIASSSFSLAMSISLYHAAAQLPANLFPPAVKALCLLRCLVPGKQPKTHLLSEATPVCF